MVKSSGTVVLVGVGDVEYPGREGVQPGVDPRVVGLSTAHPPASQAHLDTVGWPTHHQWASTVSGTTVFLGLHGGQLTNLHHES